MILMGNLHKSCFGLINNGKKSYLKNPWNVLDFIIIIFSILSLTPLPDSLKIVKMFRVIRVFRLLGKNEGLQLAVKALISALPEIISVTFIALFFFLVLGIIAVSYFKGEFYYCNTVHLPDLDLTLIVSKWDCISYGGLWLKLPYSFDNIFSSIRTMFQIATTAGWADVLLSAMKSSDIDYAPS